MKISIGRPKLFAATLCLLIISAITTFTYIPNEFKNQGGSCYQGIVIFFTNIIMIFCLASFIIAFILTFLSKYKFSILISSLSFFLWIFWAFASSIDFPIDGLRYFSLFTIASFLCVFYIFKVQGIRTIKNV